MSCLDLKASLRRGGSVISNRPITFRKNRLIRPPRSQRICAFISHMTRMTFDILKLRSLTMQATLIEEILEKEDDVEVLDGTSACGFVASFFPVG